METRKNLIFIHIPKTGGLSIVSMLHRMYGTDEIYPRPGTKNNLIDDAELRDMDPDRRQRIRLLSGHMMFGYHNRLVGPSEYLAFIRHPVDRVISFYYFIKSKKDHLMNHEIKGGEISLYDFVDKTSNASVNNACVKFLSGMTEGEEDHEMLRTSLDHIREYFPVVGVLERFEESLILLKNRHHWRVPYYRKGMNRNMARPLRESIDERTMGMIMERNKEDMLLYEAMQLRLEEQLNILGKEQLQRELVKLKLMNRLYNSHTIRNVVHRVRRPFR